MAVPVHKIRLFGGLAPTSKPAQPLATFHWGAGIGSQTAVRRGLLTHASLIALTATLFALLWYLPFWLAFVPGVLLTHRIGVLLHEYLHGIPFRRYRDKPRRVWFVRRLIADVRSAGTVSWDASGASLLAECRGGLRLSQRRRTPAPNRLWGGFPHWKPCSISFILVEAFRGRQPYVRVRRVVAGFALSVVFAALWWQAGRGDIILKVLALNAFTTLVPVSLRGAVEHHSVPGDPGFANEYEYGFPCSI